MKKQKEDTKVIDPKKALLDQILHPDTNEVKKASKYDEMQSRLTKSLKRGRLTEDLLSEVVSLFE